MPRPPSIVAHAIALTAIAACRGHAEPRPSPAAATDPATSDPVAAVCDTDALRDASTNISEHWSSWSPAAGTVPDFSRDAIEAVWTACPTLPAEARLVLDAAIDHGSEGDLAQLEGRPRPATNSDPLDTLLPGHASYHSADAARVRAALDWHTSVCAGYPAIAEEMSRAGASERGAILWDRCLGALDLVTREEFVASPRLHGTVGFAMRRWLTTEARVDDAIAKPLARAIVLDGHWLVRPPDGLLLPATPVATTIDDGTPLYVGPRDIVFARQELATLDASGALQTELTPRKGEPIIGPVFDLVAEEADKQKELSRKSGRDVTSPLLLVVHRDLPWSTLRPVLASAVAGGFERVALVGLAEDTADPLRFVLIHDATGAGARQEIAATTTVQGVVDLVLRSKRPPRLVR